MATSPEAQMVLAYRQLRTDVRRLLMEAKAQGLSHAFLQSQVTQINKAIETAEATAATFISGDMPAEYVDSAASAQLTLTKSGARIMSEKFTGVDRAAVRTLQTGLTDRLGEMKRSLTLGLGLGDPRIAAKAIKNVLEGGSDLVKLVGGELKVLTPSGRFWDPDAYAKMLGRTAIADSRRVAFGQRYKQNGIDVVKIIANGSNHITCIAWEGVSVSLTGETPGMPTMAQARAAGLFHPNCRHRYVMDRKATQGPVPVGIKPQAPKTPPPATMPSPMVLLPRSLPAPRAPRRLQAAEPSIPEPSIPDPKEVPAPRTPTPGRSR